MSTRDIYSELLFMSAGPDCTPIVTEARERREDGHVYGRLQALRPWLDTQLAPGERTALADAVRDEQASVSYAGCPSQEEHRRRRARLRLLVNELQRRAGRHDGR